MGKHLRFDYSNALAFFGPHELEQMEPAVQMAHDQLHRRSGAGREYLGWIDLPENYDREEFERIQRAAEKIRSDSDALVVIGIGGSYLGARAALEMLTHTYYNEQPAGDRQGPEIHFAGNHLSSTGLGSPAGTFEGEAGESQCHLQIGNDDRTGDRLPHPEGVDGTAVWKRRGEKTDLCHHRP